MKRADDGEFGRKLSPEEAAEGATCVVQGCGRVKPIFGLGPLPRADWGWVWIALYIHDDSLPRSPAPKFRAVCPKHAAMWVGPLLTGERPA
jgi:hypothetical protein